MSEARGHSGAVAPYGIPAPSGPGATYGIPPHPGAGAPMPPPPEPQAATTVTIVIHGGDVRIEVKTGDNPLAPCRLDRPAPPPGEHQQSWQQQPKPGEHRPAGPQAGPKAAEHKQGPQRAHDDDRAPRGGPWSGN